MPDPLALLLVDVARQDRAAFVEAVLGPVLSQRPRTARDLLETLDALYGNGGRTAATAAALYCHDKTVRYRLRVVEKLTGLRLNDPPDRLRLDLAVLLRRDSGQKVGSQRLPDHPPL